MKKIDRMELDDLGANPRKLASELIKNLDDTMQAIPVREIALAVDIVEIREQPLKSLEGALFTPEDKSEGTILVNANGNENRKRFTIAHELGHYLNIWHKSSGPNGFECTKKDLQLNKFSKGDRAAQMEVEANRFAAELLMPYSSLRKFMREKKEVSFESILSFASQFEVSKEAAIRRYITESDEPAAAIFSVDRTVRYIVHHKDFPRLSLRNGDPIPSYCRSFRHDGTDRISTWYESSSELWVEKQISSKIYDQTLVQQGTYRVTLLTLDEDSLEDDDDSKSDWDEPRFRRR